MNALPPVYLHPCQNFCFGELDISKSGSTNAAASFWVNPFFRYCVGPQSSLAIKPLLRWPGRQRAKTPQTRPGGSPTAMCPGLRPRSIYTSNRRPFVIYLFDNKQISRQKRAHCRDRALLSRFPTPSRCCNEMVKHGSRHGPCNSTDFVAVSVVLDLGGVSPNPAGPKLHRTSNGVILSDQVPGSSPLWCCHLPGQ